MVYIAKEDIVTIKETLARLEQKLEDFCKRQEQIENKVSEESKEISELRKETASGKARINMLMWILATLSVPSIISVIKMLAG